jgi:hypothetical protein
MRQILHKETSGIQYYVNVPDSAPDEHSSYGIRVGPPDLSGLKLPVEIEVALNNALVARRLITLNDVRARPQEVFAALQTALKVDTTVIMNLYKGEAK